MPEENYYDILGVSKDADPAVIRAAYKALANLYHPDKGNFPKSTSEQKIKALNKAYSVLSDPKKRKEYDAGLSNTYLQLTTDKEIPNHIFKDPDWDLAVEYHSKAAEAELELRKLSKPLSLLFRILLLETKQFNSAHKLADDLRSAFLKDHFGKSRQFQMLGQKLILDGKEEAAIELNNVIRVLGGDANYEASKEKILSKFNLDPLFYLVTDMDHKPDWLGQIEVRLQDGKIKLIAPDKSCVVTSTAQAKRKAPSLQKHIAEFEKRVWLSLGAYLIGLLLIIWVSSMI